MLPLSSLDNLHDRHVVNTEAVRDCLPWNATRHQGADFTDLRFSQLCVVVLFASLLDVGLAALSALADSILHVVRDSTNEQVIGTDTRRIIAVMTDIETLRNGTIRKFIRNAMGWTMPTFAVPNAPIATAVPRCRPQPAGISLLHLIPEAIRYGNTVMGLQTCLAAILSEVVLNSIRTRTELTPALLAYTNWLLVLAVYGVAGMATKLACFAWFGRKDATALDANDAILGGHIELPFDVSSLRLLTAARGHLVASILAYAC